MISISMGGDVGYSQRGYQFLDLLKKEKCLYRSVYKFL